MSSSSLAMTMPSTWATKVRVASSSIASWRTIGRLTWFDECSIEVGDDVGVGDVSCAICVPVSWEEWSIGFGLWMRLVEVF